MPTKDLDDRIKWAESMMRLNGRCALVERSNGNAVICKAKKNHPGPHVFESVAKVIPF